MRAPRLLCGGVIVVAVMVACVAALAAGHAFGTRLSRATLAPPAGQPAPAGAAVLTTFT